MHVHLIALDCFPAAFKLLCDLNTESFWDCGDERQNEGGEQSHGEGSDVHYGGLLGERLGIEVASRVRDVKEEKVTVGVPGSKCRVKVKEPKALSRNGKLT